jgi:hypothetical protein
MSIICEEWKDYKSGALEGFCTIYVGKWDAEIPGCKIFCKENRRWFSLPSREYKDDSGEQKWAPLFKIRDPEKFKAFNALALEAVTKFRADNPIEAPASQEPTARITPAEDGLPF